jgi:hypothetical protein
MTTVARTIDAYASTAGARRAQVRASNGRQPGDWEHAAEAIIRVEESPAPPLHVVLGNARLQLGATSCATCRARSEWEDVSLATDFPEA